MYEVEDEEKGFEDEGREREKRDGDHVDMAS